MDILRLIGRPLLGSVFVYGGVETLRKPAPRVALAEPIVAPIAERVPALSPETLVKANAAAMVAGGVSLGLGILPRAAALGLAATLIPTTLAAHSFWKESDAAIRGRQELAFYLNASILGGLLIAGARQKSQ